MTHTLAIFFLIGTFAFGQETVNGDKHYYGAVDVSHATTSIPFTSVTVDPTGNCTNPLQWVQNSTTGKASYCLNGVWTTFSGSGSGQGFTFRGAWAASTAYNAYDVLTYGGQTYEVGTAFTSGTTFSTTNLNLWAQAGATGATGATGPQGPTGPTGPQGPQGPAGSAFPGDQWYPAASGCNMNGVTSAGQGWMFPNNTTINLGGSDCPRLQPAWELNGLTYLGAWAANTAYTSQDVVNYNGTNYIGNNSFTSGSSFNSSNWTAYAPYLFTLVTTLPSNFVAGTTPINFDIDFYQFDTSGAGIVEFDFSAACITNDGTSTSVTPPTFPSSTAVTTSLPSGSGSHMYAASGTITQTSSCKAGSFLFTQFNVPPGGMATGTFITPLEIVGAKLRFH